MQQEKEGANRKTLLISIVLFAVAVILIIIAIFTYLTLSAKGDLYYLERAYEEEDVNLCNKISNASFREECISELSADFSEEEALILDRAIEERNLELCEELGEEVKKICIVSYYVDIAILDRNVEICNIIETQDGKAECSGHYYNFLAIEQNNVAFCDNIQDQELRNECVEQFVIP